jgi:hypothetical protein
VKRRRVYPCDETSTRSCSGVHTSVVEVYGWWSAPARWWSRREQQQQGLFRPASRRPGALDVLLFRTMESAEALPSSAASDGHGELCYVRLQALRVLSYHCSWNGGVVSDLGSFSPNSGSVTFRLLPYLGPPARVNAGDQYFDERCLPHPHPF